MSDYRTPEYLSPSSLATWERDQDEYFIRYICPKDIRPDRPPQTDYMSVGSAFDALVKSVIHRRELELFGDERDGFRLRDLVAAQCEEHTLPESLAIACDVFEQYEETGALGDLLRFIEQSPTPSKMEYELRKTVGGVPMLGKPDLHFGTRNGAHVIVDFKVSGACSKHGVSAQQGYQTIRSIHGGRGDGLPHVKYVSFLHKSGVPINAVAMNVTTDYWADQLATYAWSLGEKVGSEDFVVQIEQLACRPCPPKDKGDRLRVRCATHRSVVDGDYQQDLLARYQRCWSHVSGGHYFSELCKSESDAHADHLIRLVKNPTLLPPDLSNNDISVINFGGENDV